MTYSDAEYHVDRAGRIEGVINTLSINEFKLALAMAENMHRTNQQAFTRLAVAWLKVCGTDDYRFDGRNEASAAAGKALKGQLDDIYLPLI